MTPALGARAAASAGAHAADGASVLYPQSSSPDGLQRLQAAWEMPRRFGFFTEVVNNHIGVLYVVTGFLFFLGAGVLALLMRIQLAYPGIAFLDAGTYTSSSRCTASRRCSCPRCRSSKLSPCFSCPA